MRKVIGIILIILGVVAAVNMAKNSSGKSDKETAQERGPYGTTGYGKGKVLARYSAPFILFGIGLRLLLSGGGSAGPISIPLPQRSGSRNSSAGTPGNPALRGGQNTFASNPAQLNLNYAYWLAANPRFIAFFSTFALGGLGLLLFKWQAGIVILVVTSIVFWRSRQEMRRKFVIGDVCPAVVLSAEKGLVAVWTDLKAAANIARPALKILRQPLKRMKIYALQDGMRVATVAEYYGNAQETTWQNFFPEVIPCVVHDETENQRILDLIPEAQWQAIDQAIAQLPVSHPGLYRLWGGNLAADASAAIPWLQRKRVRIGLIAFGCLGLFFISMQAWVERSTAKREQQALLNQTRPSATGGPLAAEPQTRNEINFDGKVLTFTNTMGTVLKNVALLRATQGTLTYRNQGREQTMPLSTVPVDIQAGLGIPEHWHGYRAALNASQATMPPIRDSTASSNGPKPASTGAYHAGQKIYAQWAGSWIPGTVIEPFGIGMSYRVQLNDPRFRNPMVLSTNLLRPQ